ncbi:MAG: hypothetical protein DI606_12035 [Sphingobium sp.]|nr:MAG: hypothetical protein DI606_12035 [Sphingobium sp.]
MDGRYDFIVFIHIQLSLSSLGITVYVSPCSQVSHIIRVYVRGMFNAWIKLGDILSQRSSNISDFIQVNILEA